MESSETPSARKASGDVRTSRSCPFRSVTWTLRSLLGVRRQAAGDATPAPCPASQAWVLENRIARWHARLVMRHVDLRPGMQVLDVGCGVGRFSLPMATSVRPEGEVVALDLQAEMLERLSQKATAAGVPNITTIHGRAGEGRLPSLQFDRVLMASVLGEIPLAKRAAALREVRQALRPDGILYIVEVARFDPDYLAIAQVEQLVRDGGLRPGKARKVWPAYVMACRQEPD